MQTAMLLHPIRGDQVRTTTGYIGRKDHLTGAYLDFCKGLLASVAKYFTLVMDLFQTHV